MAATRAHDLDIPRLRIIDSAAERSGLSHRQEARPRLHRQLNPVCLPTPRAAPRRAEEFCWSQTLSRSEYLSERASMLAHIPQTRGATTQGGRTGRALGTENGRSQLSLIQSGSQSPTRMPRCAGCCRAPYTGQRSRASASITVPHSEASSSEMKPHGKLHSRRQGRRGQCGWGCREQQRLALGDKPALLSLGPAGRLSGGGGRQRLRAAAARIHVRPDDLVTASSTLDPPTGKVRRTHTHTQRLHRRQHMDVCRYGLCCTPPMPPWFARRSPCGRVLVAWSTGLPQKRDAAMRLRPPQ